MEEPSFHYEQDDKDTPSDTIGRVTTYTYVFPARKRKVRENGATDPYIGGVTTFVYDRQNRLMGCVRHDGKFLPPVDMKPDATKQGEEQP